MKTIEEIRTQKEGQTFDCKSAQIEPKALAVPIVAMAKCRWWYIGYRNIRQDPENRGC